jgi:hypothetical protein
MKQQRTCSVRLPLPQLVLQVDLLLPILKERTFLVSMIVAGERVPDAAHIRNCIGWPAMEELFLYDLLTAEYWLDIGVSGGRCMDLLKAALLSISKVPIHRLGDVQGAVVAVAMCYRCL